MFILKNDEMEPGDELEPCDVRPSGEAEQCSAYGYQDHTVALNDAVYAERDNTPDTSTARHPGDWPSRGMARWQQSRGDIHRIMAVDDCVVYTEGAFDLLAFVEGPPRPMPAWQLGSSL